MSKYTKQLSSTMNNKYEKLLNKIDKIEEHMIITNKNQVSIQININKMGIATSRELESKFEDLNYNLQKEKEFMNESLNKQFENIHKKLNKTEKEEKLKFINMNNKLDLLLKTLNKTMELKSKSLNNKIISKSEKKNNNLHKESYDILNKKLDKILADDKLKINSKLDLLSKSLIHKLDKILNNKSFKSPSHCQKIDEKFENLINPLIDKMDKWSTVLTQNYFDIQKKLNRFEKDKLIDKKSIGSSPNKLILTLCNKIDKLKKLMINNQIITQTKLNTFEKEFDYIKNK